MLIKSITFNLENCDSITIDGKYIGEIDIKYIQSEIIRRAANDVNLIEVANFVAIEIHKDANKPHAQFGQMPCRMTVFDRLLAHNDIVSISVVLWEPGTHYYIIKDYLVNWDYYNMQENSYQSCKLSQFGWLYLTIGKNVDINKVFWDWRINDAQMLKCKEFTYRIGDGLL